MVSSHLRRIYYFFPFSVFSVRSVVENASFGILQTAPIHGFCSSPLTLFHFGGDTLRQPTDVVHVAGNQFPVHGQAVVQGPGNDMDVQV